MAHLRRLSEEAAGVIRSSFPAWRAPVAFVQLGIGFELDCLIDRALGVLPLAALPGMPEGDSPGGSPLLLTLGEAGETQLLVASGHRYLYEGYGVEACVLPVCAAAAAGVRHVALVDAAAGIREELKPGASVVLTDFVNALGTSPLVGNCDLGPECFLDMTDAFSQEMNSELVNCAPEAGLRPRLGIYQASLGPQFHTPAEIAVARAHGADVVGAGIVLETIAAKAMGCQVLGLALVSRVAASYAARPASFADVRETCRFCSPLLMRALHACFAKSSTGSTVTETSATSGRVTGHRGSS